MSIIEIFHFSPQDKHIFLIHTDILSVDMHAYKYILINMYMHVYIHMSDDFTGRDRDTVRVVSTWEN